MLLPSLETPDFSYCMYILRVRSGFPELVGDRTNAKRLHKFLDTVGDLDLSLLRDDRLYRCRFNTIADNPSFEGAHADFVLPEACRTKGDSHISAYSIAGPCLTITTNGGLCLTHALGLMYFVASPRAKSCTSKDSTILFRSRLRLLTATSTLRLAKAWIFTAYEC